MKKPTPLMLVLLSFLLITSCSKDEAATGGEDWTPNAIPVEMQIATPQTFTNTLAYNGSLQAIQTARIVPEIPAKIELLNVQIGDFVLQRDTLVQMDIATLELQFKQAQAGQAVAHANYKDAKKNWDRVQTLRRESAVSEQQFEKMKLSLEAAQSQLNQARAGLDLVKMQIEKATLTAPFDGVITQKGFELGDLYNPAAMRPVYILQNISRIKVELQVTSNEINTVQKGQPAQLKVHYLAETVAGVVTLVGVAADPLSKTFLVECQFNNVEGLLKVGTFGQVSITIDELHDVLVIPRQALIGSTHIFIMANGRAYKRDVTISRENQDELVINSGLSENEIYIVGGAYILADSSLVQEAR